MISTSSRWELNLVDFYKSFRGGAVVFIGSFLALFIPHVEQMLATGIPTDIPALRESLTIAAISVLVELGRRYVTDQSPAA